MYLCNLPSRKAWFLKGRREQPRTWSWFKISCLICQTRVTQTLVKMTESVWTWKGEQAAGTTDLLPPCPGFLRQVMQLKTVQSFRSQRSEPPGLQGAVETKHFTTVAGSYQQPRGQVSLHKAKKPHSVVLAGCVNRLLTRWERCVMNHSNGNCSSGIENVRILGWGHDQAPDPLKLCFVFPDAHQDKPSSSLVRGVSHGRSTGTSWECRLVELLEPLS